MVVLSVYQGTFNSNRFLGFIELLLTQMQPFPAPQSVIVMDNCKIHKDPRILNAIIDACVIFKEQIGSSSYFFVSGMRYEFLPPYSPDLNPIELSFNDLKNRLRREGDDFRHIDYDGDEADIIALLHEKVMSVSREHAEKWFRWSGYWA
jgi:transposase